MWKIHISLKTDTDGAEKLSALAKHCAQVFQNFILGLVSAVATDRGPSVCLFQSRLRQWQFRAPHGSLHSTAQPSLQQLVVKIPHDNGEYRATPWIFACRFLCPECFLIQQTSNLVALPHRWRNYMVTLAIRFSTKSHVKIRLSQFMVISDNRWDNNLSQILWLLKMWHYYCSPFCYFIVSNPRCKFLLQ